MRESVSISPSQSPAYPVFVGSDFAIADDLQALSASRTFVISQQGLEDIVIRPFLAQAFPGKEPDDVILLKQGEEEKHFRNLEPVYNRLLEKGADRKSVIIALGGGVVGDFAGFVAASLLRGVRFVQVPTTLLSAVDSSVGGKVAVNVDHGKNMVGAFYHPAFVHFNTSTLSTLPQKEWVCGLAEMAKHAFIHPDRSVFDFMHSVRHRLTDSTSAELRRAVIESIGVKAAVVAQDEKEEGLRAVLNLGHTTAHAIESVTGLSAFSHGEAVSRGLVTALLLSREAAGLSGADFDTMLALLSDMKLPMDTAGLAAGDLLAHMKYDKKTEHGTTRFVLLEGLGRARYGCAVDPALFRSVWQEQARRFG
ncbi:MAG: 3-dehydroquinate synthase [Spirochaetia bacterium]|nr:3-dehydroquinate synthase [Spirochaetia bacterium]